MDDADHLRREVTQRAAPIGQRAFGDLVGIDQGSVSRYLRGARLTPTLAAGLRAQYPELRDLVDRVYWTARNMQNSNRESASGVGAEQDESICAAP